MEKRGTPSPVDGERAPEQAGKDIVLALQRVFIHGDKRAYPSLTKTDTMNARQLARVIGVEVKQASLVLQVLQTLPGIIAKTIEDQINIKDVEKALQPQPMKNPAPRRKQEQGPKVIDQIKNIIEKKPEGITIWEIARILESPNRTAILNKLRALIREGVITGEPIEIAGKKEMRYFMAESEG